MDVISLLFCNEIEEVQNLPMNWRVVLLILEISVGKYAECKVNELV
ncbi:hypothetical protein [Bacillus sp. 123MFChir2]|nr:hypothetical protein [Bacillus sp. 123MFChir2]